MNYKIILLTSIIILSIALWVGLKNFQEQDNVGIHIAFVGPMSGESATVGKSMAKAIQLHLDTINRQGGINHQKVILDIFDDQNDVNQAIKVAQDIAEQNRAIAVIGHHYSACSINGGIIYKRQKIPAITPASTHIEVTQDNDWYFRTVFNDNLQASFLAHYAKRILQQNTVSIIYSDEDYGSSLASLFEKASKNLLFGIIAFVFEKPITSLLATSGVVAMIAGLAVQMNLSNVLSGIALNLERSLRIGDWVKIGAFDDSRVVNINWRVTQIETRMGYIVSIPNSTVSNSAIHNFSYPDNQYWLLCRVPIDPKHDPRIVEEILLNAVLSVEQDVVKDFKPSIWLENIQVEEVSDWVAIYVVFFKTENYQYKFRVLKNVWKNIWIHLNQAGIIPRVAMTEGVEKHKTAFTMPELENVLNQNQLQTMLASAR
jgi:small-conductance mechanosensitive channel